MESRLLKKGPVHYFNELFKNKSDNVFVQFIRNGVTSVIAFAFDFGILYALTDVFLVYYLISASVSYLTGHVVNYLLSIRWVFSRRKYDAVHVEFTIFLVIGFLGLGLNALLMWGFTDLAGLHYLMSKLATIVIVYFFNFFAKKYLLFHKTAD
ncbi:MAG: GtrA family protein [Spirochaetes bacterium]|jgi:putative flippase GtrA|nr:GtrA family protein [Spirochaetota bacterium]